MVRSYHNVLEINEALQKKKSEIKSEILIYFCPLIVEDQERKISNAKKINKKKTTHSYNIGLGLGVCRSHRLMCV